jgi:hypothetical protein
MKTKSIITLTSLVLLPFLVNGCLVAAIGAGVGAAHAGTAKKKEAYASYCTGADKNNTEREIHGLTPIHVMTYDEWQHGEKTTPAK